MTQGEGSIEDNHDGNEWRLLDGGFNREKMHAARSAAQETVMAEAYIVQSTLATVPQLLITTESADGDVRR